MYGLTVIGKQSYKDREQYEVMHEDVHCTTNGRPAAGGRYPSHVSMQAQ